MEDMNLDTTLLDEYKAQDPTKLSPENRQIIAEKTGQTVDEVNEMIDKMAPAWSNLGEGEGEGESFSVEHIVNSLRRLESFEGSELELEEEKNRIKDILKSDIETLRAVAVSFALEDRGKSLQDGPERSNGSGFTKAGWRARYRAANQGSAESNSDTSVGSESGKTGTREGIAGPGAGKIGDSGMSHGLASEPEPVSSTEKEIQARSGKKPWVKPGSGGGSSGVS